MLHTLLTLLIANFPLVEKKTSGFICHPKRSVTKEAINLKDPEPISTAKETEKSFTGNEMGPKKGNVNRRMTIRVQLKDPEPAFSAANDRVRSSTATKKQDKPVQDFVIHLTNPDISTAKSHLSVGLKRKNEDLLLSKDDTKEDLNLKPAHIKSRLTTKTNSPSETHKKRSKILQNKVEFPYGTVVSINGRDMHDARWEDRKTHLRSSESYKTLATMTGRKQRASTKIVNRW